MPPFYSPFPWKTSAIKAARARDRDPLRSLQFIHLRMSRKCLRSIDTFALRLNLIFSLFFPSLFRKSKKKEKQFLLLRILINYSRSNILKKIIPPWMYDSYLIQRLFYDVLVQRDLSHVGPFRWDADSRNSSPRNISQIPRWP